MAAFGESEFTSALVRVKCLAFDLNIILEERDFSDAQRARVLAELCDVARVMFSGDPEADEDARARALLMRLGFALWRWVKSEPVQLDDAALLRWLGFPVRAEDVVD